MEHRNHPRRRFALNALLYHPQGFFCPCRVDNISSAGLFIRMIGASENQFFTGSCVDVVIDASPSMAKLIEIKALVVHKRDDGIGLQCENGIFLHELSKVLQ